MARRGAPDRAADAARPSTYAAGEVSTSDWPAQVADTIEQVVGTIRDNTTGRAITAARGVVFGMFAIFAGTAVALFLAIAAVRLVVVYLPDSVFGEEHVWAAHTLVGLPFTLAGLVLLRKARKVPKTAR